MRFHALIPTLSMAGLFVLVPKVHAADTLLHSCKGEIDKFRCEAKSESYAYDCLNKHKEQRTKYKGFSSKCYKAYASFEKSIGGGEKIDSHQVEHPEHVN